MGLMARRSALVGQVTRGTTNTNRLRRVDRWIAHLPALRHARHPLVVDLGYGASGVTAFELWTRLARVRPDVEVVGIEIDPARVERANEQLARVRSGATPFAADARVSFVRGGFEIPVEGRPAVIRAMNVLRQYDEAEVAAAWTRIAARLAPSGVLVEGTCDELGRIGSWADVAPDGVATRLTLSLRLATLATESPSIVAERLPKALIHHNVPGEPVHALLAALDGAWERSAPLAPFGVEQRWIATIEALRTADWPIEGSRSRWRLGELSVPWPSVAPA
jgi:hypothetical protein